MKLLVKKLLKELDLKRFLNKRLEIMKNNKKIFSKFMRVSNEEVRTVILP